MTIKEHFRNSCKEQLKMLQHLNYYLQKNYNNLYLDLFDYIFNEYQSIKDIMNTEDEYDIINKSIRLYLPEIFNDAKLYNINLDENYVFYHFSGKKYKHYIGKDAPEFKKDKEIAYDIFYALMLFNKKNCEFHKSMINNYINNNPRKKVNEEYLRILGDDIGLEIDLCAIFPEEFEKILYKNFIIKDGCYKSKKSGREIFHNNRKFIYKLYNYYTTNKSFY